MIKHIVSFKLKGSEAQRLELSRQFKAALEALPAQIEVLQSIEVGINEKPVGDVGHRTHSHRRDNGRRGGLCQTSGPRGRGCHHRRAQRMPGLRGLLLLNRSPKKGRMQDSRCNIISNKSLTRPRTVCQLPMLSVRVWLTTHYGEKSSVTDLTQFSDGLNTVQ